MSFEREIWLDWYRRKPCPTCNIGTLNPTNETIGITNETPNSIEMNSLGGYYQQEFIFSVHLKCSYAPCGQYVAVSGEKCFYEGINDITGEQETKLSFYPVSFYPAPNIIKIPKACSEQFKKTLKESFSLYWLDLGSCANKIRISIEVLMTDCNIPKTTLNPKKNENSIIPLHRRLEIFGTDYKEGKFKKVSDFLLSVKWIGNEGSHNPEIKRDDVLSAYELLDFSLEILYSEREKKLLAVSKEVTNRLDPKKNFKTL